MIGPDAGRLAAVNFDQIEEGRELDFQEFASPCPGLGGQRLGPLYLLVWL